MRLQLIGFLAVSNIHQRKAMKCLAKLGTAIEAVVATLSPSWEFKITKEAIEKLQSKRRSGGGGRGNKCHCKLVLSECNYSLLCHCHRKCRDNGFILLHVFHLLSLSPFAFCHYPQELFLAFIA